MVEHEHSSRSAPDSGRSYVTPDAALSSVSDNLKSGRGTPVDQGIGDPDAAIISALHSQVAAIHLLTNAMLMQLEAFMNPRGASEAGRPEDDKREASPVASGPIPEPPRVFGRPHSSGEKQ